MKDKSYGDSRPPNLRKKAPVVSTLTLNLPRIDVAKPCLLFARTCKLLNRTGLVVYKSVLMRDSDEVFSEVRDFIQSQSLRLVRKGVFFDAEMLFSQGELSIYIEPAAGKDGEAQDGLDLVDWDDFEHMREEAIRIVKERVAAVN